jgi:hypothetical protein
MTQELTKTPMTRVNLKTITKALFSELSANLSNLREAEDKDFYILPVPIGEDLGINIYINRNDFGEIKTKIESNCILDQAEDWRPGQIIHEEIDFDELLLDEDKKYLGYLVEKELELRTKKMGSDKQRPFEPTYEDSYYTEVLIQLYEDSKKVIGHD